MARKGSQPALYELMGEDRDQPAEAPPRQPPEPRPTWLSPGRTLRLPVGYLWLGAAGLVVVLGAAFLAGYRRGHSEAQTVAQRDWLATHQPALPLPPPEVAPPPPLPPPAAVEAADGPDEPVAPAAWGEILSDPRVAGLNYFVLIHTTMDNAATLAEFCRERGVEAYVVKAKNVSLYRVIALPGYARGERPSQRVRALEHRIEEVARQWKLQINPKDDLAYYPERFP